jgi:hypothetical protein
MVAENPTWGAPRIHGELKMLGFDISERTVLRWMRKAPRNPEPATAVPELLYPGATTAEWHFPQENATLRYSEQGTCILEPLKAMGGVPEQPS